MIPFNPLPHTGRSSSHHKPQLGQIKIAIPGIAHYDFVRISDIIRCEGWQKYTCLYLHESKCLVSSYHIGFFKERLEAYPFFSPHKSHLINTNQIAMYRKEGVIVMEDGAEVPVARRRKEAFMEEVVHRFLLCC